MFARFLDLLMQIVFTLALVFITCGNFSSIDIQCPGKYFKFNDLCVKKLFSSAIF